MDPREGPPEGTEDELVADALGVSETATEEGWEATDYIAPGDDWTIHPDGSFTSPDGRLRSRPLAGPEPG